MNFANTLHKYPFFRLLIPLLIGIVIGTYQSGYSAGIFLFSSAVLFALLHFIIKRTKKTFHYNWLFGMAVFLFFLASGMFLSCRKNEFLRLFRQKAQKENVYVGTIKEDLNEKNTTVACLVSIFELDEKTNNKTDVILYIAKDSSSLALKIGDLLIFSADFSYHPEMLNPEEFDYIRYLNIKGIASSAYISSGKWAMIGKDTRVSLKNEAKKIQSKLLSVYKTYEITGEEFAVLSALTLGNTEYLDRSILNSYAATGASHILSVSGLHVGIVFFILNFILVFLLKADRFIPLKILILIVALWGYAFITGLSPSVIRASVMLSLSIVGIVLKRKSLIYNTIAASAFGMLFYNPFYLYDVSFQLSYSAVISIVFFQPKIYGLLSFRNRLADKTWNLLTVSIASQLGTFPIAIYYFNQFPLYFWLSGFVVIPLSGLAIYLTLALFVFADIPFIGHIIAFVLGRIMKIMNVSVHLIEKLPYALFNRLDYELYDLFFLYLLLFLFAFYLVSRKYRLLLLSLCCFFVYLTTETLIKYKKMNTDTLAVYNISKTTAVNKMEHGKNALFYRGDMNNISNRINNFWVKNRVGMPDEMRESGFLFGDKRVLIVNDEKYKNIETESPLMVDYLILSQNAPYTIDEIRNLFRFNILIFDSSNTSQQINKWKKRCNELNIAYHNVKEEGAYCVRVEK